MTTSELMQCIDNAFSIKCHSVNFAEECHDIIQNHTFKTLTLNIRSLNRNFNSFLIVLKRFKTDFDAIILTECWLKNSPIIPQIEGYNFYHTSKHVNKAGGVVVYIKDVWSPVVHEPTLTDADCIVLRIPNVITILGVYRSPSFSDTNNFIDSMQRIVPMLKSKPCTLFTGDINININDEHSGSVSTYLCALAELGLKPAVNKPTRENSCIDHVFFLGDMHVETVVCPSSITDHNIVITGITGTIVKPAPSPRYRLRVDYSSIADELSNIDWSTLYSISNVTEQTDIFVGIMKKLLDNHSQQMPLSRSKIILKPWMTQGLIRCSKVKDKLHMESKRFPTCNVKAIVFARYRNFYIALIRKVRNHYQSNLLVKTKDNPRKLWNTINEITNRKVTKGSQNLDLLSIKCNPEESINMCNAYFASIGETFANEILVKLNYTQNQLAQNVNTSNSPSSSFFLEPTDREEVNSIICGLKPNTAPGPDGISVQFIKILKNLIAEPLAAIINTSLTTGIVPDDWKFAAVVPIHKGGDTDSPNNFRPISLLPVFSKILERVVNKRLVDYIESNNFLSPNQFGFRKKRSTEDAVKLLTDHIVQNLDDGSACVGVFLDIAKAFDTVSIPILLKRLENIGVRGIALDWFASYLTGRQQCLKIDSRVSSPGKLSFGVPQGSVLGPTLFLIYLNELASLPLKNAKIICYADDTAIIFQEASWSDCFVSVQQGMVKVMGWLSNNLLTLNTSKTKYICFHKTMISAPLTTPDIIISDHDKNVENADSGTCNAIQRARTIKYLGVIIDEKLSFRDHIAALSSRTRKIIYVMKQIRDVASADLVKNIYISLCQSVLTYCIQAWGGIATTHLISLERAQRSVIKVMLSRPIRYPTEKLYKESKLLSIRRLYINASVSATYKQMLTSNAYQNSLERRTFRAHVPAVKTSFAQRFSVYLFPHLFNKICKVCKFKNETVREVKSKTNKYLNNLNYHEVEQLLRSIR